MEPTFCMAPLTKVADGNGSAPVSALPLEVQLIFENGIVLPVASVNAAGTVAVTSAADVAAPLQKGSEVAVSFDPAGLVLIPSD